MSASKPKEQIWYLEGSAISRTTKALPPLADRPDVSSISFLKPHAAVGTRMKDHARIVGSDDFIQLPTTNESINESLLHTSTGDWKERGYRRGKDKHIQASNNSENEHFQAHNLGFTGHDGQPRVQGGHRLQERQRTTVNRRSNSNNRNNNDDHNVLNSDKSVAGALFEGIVKTDGNGHVKAVPATGKLPSKGGSSLKPLAVNGVSAATETSAGANTGESVPTYSTKQINETLGTSQNLRSHSEWKEPLTHHVVSDTISSIRENLAEHDVPITHSQVSRQVSKDGIYADILCTNLDDITVLRSSSKDQTYGEDVQVNDPMKAGANDLILQERIMEGKALNRRDEDGAVMHKFSLWSKLQSPVEDVEAAPIATEATGAAGAAVQSAAYLSSIFADTSTHTIANTERRNPGVSPKVDTVDSGQSFKAASEAEAKKVSDGDRPVGRQKSRSRGPREARALHVADPALTSISPSNKSNTAGKAPFAREVHAKTSDIARMSKQLNRGTEGQTNEADGNGRKMSARDAEVQRMSEAVSEGPYDFSPDGFETLQDCAVRLRADSCPIIKTTAPDPRKNIESEHTNYANDEFEGSSNYFDEETDVDDVDYAAMLLTADSHSSRSPDRSKSPLKSSLASSLRKKIGSAGRMQVSNSKFPCADEVYDLSNADDWTRGPGTSGGKDSRVSRIRQNPQHGHRNDDSSLPSRSIRDKPVATREDVIQKVETGFDGVGITSAIQASLDTSRGVSAGSDLSQASDFEIEDVPAKKDFDIDGRLENSDSTSATPVKNSINGRGLEAGKHSGTYTNARNSEERPNGMTSGMSFFHDKKQGSILRWKRGQAIGEGSFGKVFKGLNERTGELMAVKQLFLADGSDSEVGELRKEINMICDLDHDNIVRYLGTAQSDRYLFIFLEYIPGGSIASMLEQFGAFPEDLIRRFCSQIVAGMAYLHQKGIIHRDIKGSNVLVTDDGVAKLSDFGCSKKLAGMCTASLEESLFAIKGSVPWMAPEVIKQSGHGRLSDVWSFGAMVIEMATAKPPWPDFTNNLAALFHVATSTSPPPFPAHLSEECTAFLSRCLVVDAKRRASAAELMHDPFVSEGVGSRLGV